jgi:hypothetical protein
MRGWLKSNFMEGSFGTLGTEGTEGRRKVSVRMLLLMVC